MYTKKRCVEHTFKKCTSVLRYKKTNQVKISQPLQSMNRSCSSFLKGTNYGDIFSSNVTQPTYFGPIAVPSAEKSSKKQCNKPNVMGFRKKTETNSHSAHRIFLQRVQFSLQFPPLVSRQE